MFVAANRFTVADGYGDELVERFTESSEDIAEQPGFVRFDFLVPPEDGNTYVAQTYWESEDDFEAWTDSEQFRNAHGGDAPTEMFEGHPTLETYETAITHE